MVIGAMTLHAGLASTFEKLDLVAIDVNEGWTIIRRRLFIDLFIKEEPFSSVEVFHHYPTERTLVRIFGSTALVKGGTLSEIVQNVFRKKPCFGVWRDLKGVMASVLDTMHAVDHVTMRYYSPQCKVFSDEKYGEGRYDMNPGLCKACDVLAPQAPIKLEDEPNQIADVDFRDKSESSDWIPEEEDIEIDLRPKVPMDVEEYDMKEMSAQRDDNEAPLDMPTKVPTLTKVDKPPDSVRETIAAALNQAVVKGDLTSDPLKGKKKIVLLTKDASGNLVKADPSLLKGKKIKVQKPVVTSKVQMARKVQLVAKGEYKGKERPFAEDYQWMKYLFPNGVQNRCSECGQSCHKPATLQKHLQRVHYFSWFQCPVCLLWKNKVDEIINHAKEEHDDNGELLMKCPNCEQNFLSSLLPEHVLRCFKRIYKKSKRPEERWAGRWLHNRPLSQCAFCQFTYKAHKEYRKHLVTHAEALSCKNEGCSYITDDPKRLAHHTAFRHGRDGDDLFYCDQCAKSFSTNHALAYHVKREHGTAEEIQSAVYKYHCSLCNLSFTSKLKRDSHQNKVHFKRSYPCEICGKTFPLLSTVKSHVQNVHADKETKEKAKKQCSICGKWLSCQYTLDSHMRTHTGERPYKCTICGEGFVSATWMGIHRRKMHPKQWEEEVKRREEQKVLKRKQSINPEQSGDVQSTPEPTKDTSPSNISPQSQDLAFGGWN